MLSLSISSTASIPSFASFPVSASSYFSFMLKYLISYPQEISSCPSSNRFLDFINGTLNSASTSSPLSEIIPLLEEFINFTEKADFIHTVLTSFAETYPVKKLSSFSSVHLA